jgi:hypothetical protein
MIISKAHAQRLIRTGRAIERDPVHDDGQMYWSIDRLDVQRVDHVRYVRLGLWWGLPPLTKHGRVIADGSIFQAQQGQ